MGDGGVRSPRTVMAAIVPATVATVFPGFLVGALSVQVSADLDVGTTAYGWALGSFFLAATAGSSLLGRVAQAVGPRRQIVGALAVSSLAQLAIAALARSFGVLLVFLVVAGLANAANQTAVNLALTQSPVTRLGLAMALKQSSMPSASLLAGIAVPALAVTVGWRWAYVAGALLAVGAAVAIGVVITSAPSSGPSSPRSDPVSSRRALVTAGAAAAALAFGAGALNAWVVSSGVDAGIGEGTAGLLLSAGAAAGISLRIASGLRADTTSVRPFAAAAVTAAVGAIGMIALGVRSSGTHVVATLLAFGAGWIWPVFTNFGVVRRNQDAAAAATGITQTGVYVGVFAAPLVTGALIDGAGYPTMWAVVGGVTLVGSMVAWSVADQF